MVEGYGELIHRVDAGALTREEWVKVLRLHLILTCSCACVYHHYQRLSIRLDPFTRQNALIDGGCFMDTAV